MEQNFDTQAPWEVEVKHVAIDTEGNEVLVDINENGVIQDSEYSDTPEGN